MRRFLKVVANNFSLKIISVLVAIFIWYLVVYNNDPTQTNSYQVRITVTNESYIANGKQLYRIDEEYKTVTVYVTGNRSELRGISEDNIHVVADLTQIVDMERDPIVVPLSVTVDGFDQTAISLSRNTIPITIENVASKDLVVSVSTGETEVDRNYEIGNTTVTPSNITIYGPESVINSIDSVVAEIDVTGLSESKEVSGQLIFIDKAQEKISDSILQDDITIEGGTPTVMVDVELWEKISDVKLEVEYSGQPADGYQVSSISTTPETLTVAGTPEAVERLQNDGKTITIPEEYIDVSNLSSDLQTEVDITKILPDDLKLASSMGDTVTVNVTILPDESVEYHLDVDDIQINNLSPSLTVSYDKQSINLKISGKTSVLDEITEADVSASIDLKDMKVGDYTVPLNVTLPDGCSLLGESKITIHIKESADKDSDTSS